MHDTSVIKPLNGLRALAILLVLIWHYFNCQLFNVNGEFMKALKFLTGWTWSGVDLFFILSGFLIGRILLVNKSSPNYFKTFYTRRIFRIFPAYYLIVLVFVFVVYSGLGFRFYWLTVNPFPLYSYLLYIQNFWISATQQFGPNWLGVTWSLAVEEQFYIVLPLIILLVKDKWLPFVLISGIVAAPCLRASWQGLSAYVQLPARMDTLLLGVLIAYYYLNGNIEKYFSNKQHVLLALLVLLCVAVFFCTTRLNEGIGGVYIHSVLAALYGLLLILALTLKEGNKLDKFLSAKWLAFLARLSFMIYLTHQIFSGLFHELLLYQQPQLNSLKDVAVTALALLVTILFSAASYRWFEQPLLKLGKKNRY